MTAELEAAKRTERVFQILKAQRLPADHVTAGALLCAAAMLSAEIGNTREQWLSACAHVFDGLRL